MFSFVTCIYKMRALMITKEKLREYIDQFPDELSIDELIERLLFVQKLESRINESLQNDTIDEHTLKLQMEKWFELNG